MSGPEQRGFLALLRGLADAGVDIAHNTARMAASEGRIVLHRITVRLGLIVTGLLVATTGLLLTLAGASLALARSAGWETWEALVVVGAATIVAGAAFAVRMVGRLSDPDIAFPATLAEFAADADALRRGARENEGKQP